MGSANPFYLATARFPAHEQPMTRKEKTAVAIAGAVGSAALAAALLYANKRKDKKKRGPTQPGPIPSGEKPETD